MERFNFIFKYCNNRSIWFASFVLVFFIGCTDHKTTIPFEFSEYKPRLVILSSIGTISGAEASIFWSKPLRGQVGSVPVLPKLSVYLVESGVRISEFIADSDSVGYFVINATQLNLKSGTPYTLEVLVGDKGERIFSQACYLPEKPNLKNVEGDSKNPFWYYLTWTQGPTEEGVGATALYPYLLDSLSNYIEKPRLGMYYLSSEFRFTDGKALPERNGRKRFERLIKRGDTSLAPSVDVRLAFLSPELARFKKEMDELGYFGESVYQTVRPLYSNIIGASGVFGLYNESNIVLGFE